MGILLNAAYLMMVEGKREKFKGKVLQLGRQAVLFPYASLRNMAAHLEFELTPVPGIDKGPQVRLTDEEFFLSLGFSEVESMEYGTDQGANYVWDLNHPVPEAWHRSVDFVYDGGTVEHVFHIPNCLASLCAMLKVGGRVMHDGGISGLIDHGFYAIQPTLYHDFYSVNGFETNLFTVSTLQLATWTTTVGQQAVYTPGMYDFGKCWAVDDSTIYVGVCFATKTAEFEQLVVPQQSIWARSAEIQRLKAA